MVEELIGCNITMIWQVWVEDEDDGVRVCVRQIRSKVLTHRQGVCRALNVEALSRNHCHYILRREFESV